jgi:carnitine 3-dehydrogenase
MSDIKKITCIGAGTIGSSWAAYFLMHGLDVVVQDIYEKQLDISKEKIKKILQDCVKFKTMTNDEVEETIKNVSFTTDIEKAVKHAEFIQESALEQYDVKKNIIQEVDKYISLDTIFSSSSSGLLASKLQSFSRFSDRIIVCHPFNPPHLIPLVEIVKGGASDKTVKIAVDLFEQIGKKPIILNKEMPGHVANRIQAAVWRESIDLVMQGVCSVKDVDYAVCYGPGLRWALFGQHMIFNLGGGDGGINHFMDILSSAHETWWEDMAKWNKIPDGAREKLVAGIEEEAGDRTITELVEWRDEKLVKILQLLELI